MHRLRIQRHILRNEFLALCKLLTQSAGVDAGIGLLERLCISAANSSAGLAAELETGRSWANVGAKKMRGITSTSNRDLFNGCHPPIVHAHGDEIKLMWRFRALMYETVPQTEVEFYIPGNFIPASLRAKLA